MEAYVIKSPFGYVRLSDDNIFYFSDEKLATPFSKEAGEYLVQVYKNQISKTCELVKLGNNRL